jgi:hypothetical protein
MDRRKAEYESRNARYAEMLLLEKAVDNCKVVSSNRHLTAIQNIDPKHRTGPRTAV